MKKKVTAILLGAGSRGRVYARYALDHPEEFQIVGVAEPDRAKREAMKREHHIPEDSVYETWEPLLERPCFADAALICTMDRMHTAPTVKALERGYHVLLEKPMAVQEEECRQIGAAAEKHGRLLSICHVLRFTPFYSEIKGLVDTGCLGSILAAEQIEHVGYWHQAHSFVRGNWADGQTSSPMILQKSCHDMDILSWLIGGVCTKVSSFGSLTHFQPGNAPAGAPSRCLDGCPVSNTCPYYAPRFYLEHPNAVSDGFVSMVSPEPGAENLMKALRQGPYGRCVYHCGNNVVDHQVVNLEFDNSAVASFVMTAFTHDCNRTLTLMGTKGELTGDMNRNEIRYHLFGEASETVLHPQLPDVSEGYHHGGGDYRLIENFAAMVREGNFHKNWTSAQQSLQSHLICFAAEQSRLTGKTIDLSLDKEPSHD